MKKSDCRWRAARLAIGAALALAVSAPAAAGQSAFDEIVAKAKREGAIEVWLASPVRSEVQRALFDAFDRRFGLATRWRWVATHPRRSVGRLTAEAAVGRVSADIIGGASSDILQQLLEGGLLERYPWVETFGQALPAISESAQRLLPALRGTGLVWVDAVYGLAWNTRFVSAADAPKRFRDLADPKWKGRFALNVLGGAPFDLMALAIGDAEALALVRSLLANRPVLKPGTPAVSGAITTGEAWVGISAHFTFERARRAGEPQAFRLAEDFVPVMPLHVAVPAQAPHPDTARLFAAWLVTEGARIVERMDAVSRLTDPDSALARAVAARAPSAAIVEERSLDDVRKTQEFTARVQALYTGRR